MPISISSRPASSPASPPAGLSGFVDFIATRKGAWRGLLLQAGGAFLVLALLWMVCAPLYAHLLTAFARPLIPAIESSPGTRYLVEGTQIIAERPLMRQTIESVTAGRTPMRDTSGDYPIALLAALVLATPGWSLTRRGKVVAATVGLLVLTQFLSFLITIEYTKLWPQTTAAGLVVSLDYSKTKMILFDWLYAFCEFMGRGFCALALYFGAIALVWGRPERQALAGTIGRNAPCPCGSGRKAKRCCGA